MKLSRILQLAAASAFALTASQIASANLLDSAQRYMSTFSLDCPHWYAGANVGLSHLHDGPNPGSGNSVDENGPGWNVLGGYQWNSLFGTEAGFTQYHDSIEHSGSANIASTEHYSADIAAVGRYPIANQWSILAKLGPAFSYANKIANGGGPISQKSANSVSVYWGLGVDYSLTPRADLIAQVAGAGGNNQTGSAELYSLGFTWAMV